MTGPSRPARRVGRGRPGPVRAWVGVLAIGLLAGCGGATGESADGSTDGSTGAPGSMFSTSTAAVSGSSATTWPTGVPADLGARAQAVLDEAVAAERPGCSAAFAERGEVVWAGTRGLADVTTGDPITVDSRFDIGSISKQFTAAVLLLLVQEGRLSLDDTLADHLDGFPEWAGTVSLRQLMHHRSGVPGYIPIFDAEGLMRTDPVTQDSTLDALRGVKTLDFDPGSRFEYSDSNYVLLAGIAETVAGQDLPALIRERIAGPLGLGLVLDTVDAVPGRVTGYENLGGIRTPVQEIWEPYGDGGVQASPTDLVRWADNFRTGTVGGPDLLRAQLDDLEPTDRPGESYGAGLFVQADGSFGHPGFWLGFVSRLEVRSDRLRSVAVTCNDDGVHIGTLTAALTDIWLGPA